MLNILKRNTPKIVRLYGRTLENVDYPIPGRSVRSKRQVERKPDKDLKDVSMHHRIREDGKEYAGKLKECDSFFKSLSEKKLQNDGALYKKYLRTIKEYNECQTAATLQELKNYEAVFCTSAVATKGQLFRDSKVFQVIIDEAGMCTEPETIAAIVATSAKQVVLIGDHQQLRPVVSCVEAGKKGLECSMFEQYAEMSENPDYANQIKFTTLNTQYRMVSFNDKTIPRYR